jgi:hypothetical protein
MARSNLVENLGWLLGGIRPRDMPANQDSGMVLRRNRLEADPASLLEIKLVRHLFILGLSGFQP